MARLSEGGRRGYVTGMEASENGKESAFCACQWNY